MGPAGVTVVIVEKDLLEKPMPICPTMCDWTIAHKNDSRFNTPPTFAIYVCGVYLDYLKSQGGLAWV